MGYVFIQSFEIAEDKESLNGILEISRDWDVFKDHFPGFPIMPGALMIESMAQHAVVLMLEHKQGVESVIPTLIQVERAKFSGMVRPDCKLQIQIKKEFVMYPNFKFDCETLLNGKSVAKAKLTMAFKKMPMGQGLDFMDFFLKGATK